MIRNRSIRFFAIEKLTFIYIIISAFIILFLKLDLAVIKELLRVRFIIVMIVIALAYVSSVKNWGIIKFLRIALIGGLLVYWYPETFEINMVLPNYDYLLANLDQKLFGFQAALVFSQHFPQIWLSELLNMAYFAYYPIIVGSALYIYLKNKNDFEHFIFVVLFSFFSYYLIFILFPTAGPQYYYQAIGLDHVSAGNFPDVGYYFKNNQSLMSVSKNSGFFSQMVQHTQQVGERPTAAFPSSHVGITTLIMILIIRNRKYILFALLLPLYIALVMATIYIQAHYVVDVFAGLITAFSFYYLGCINYKLFKHSLFRIPELTALIKEPIEARNL